MVDINQCPGKGVWNLDLYANKKIKITKNALSGEELLEMSDKQSLGRNKIKFNNKSSDLARGGTRPYTTSKTPLKKNDKYLSFITPIKPKPKSKFIEIIAEDRAQSFSSMDIETMDINNMEVPVIISITTKNISKIFLIDHIKLLDELNMPIPKFQLN